MKRLLFTTLLMSTALLFVLACGTNVKGGGVKYIPGQGWITYKEAPAKTIDIATAELFCQENADTSFSCALLVDDALVTSTSVSNIKWSINNEALENDGDIVALNSIILSENLSNDIILSFIYNGENVEFSKNLIQSK